jgi:hypothetical protein
MNKTYVAFDVANKSLATSIITFSDPEPKLKKILDEYIDKEASNIKDYKILLGEIAEMLERSIQAINESIEFNFLDVVDLLPDKKVKDASAVERSFCLMKYLNSIKQNIPNNPIFLVEYQMGPNDKSRAVSSQLLYFCSSYFCDVSEAENGIKIIGPTLKNMLSLRDEKSKHSYYTEKYSNNYIANKNHTKYIFNRLAEMFGIQHSIKKKRLSDIADSVCMTLAYIKFN